MSWLGPLTVPSMAGKPLAAVLTLMTDARGQGLVCDKAGHRVWGAESERLSVGSLAMVPSQALALAPASIAHPLRRVGCARSHTQAPRFQVSAFVGLGPSWRQHWFGAEPQERGDQARGPDTGRPAPLEPSLPPMGSP